MRRKTARLALYLSLALASLTTFGAERAEAVTVQGFVPEVAANVFEENGQEVAAVTINGKELVVYKAAAGSGDAAQKAEDLASELQGLFEDKKFDAEYLLPGRSGENPALVMQGQTVVELECVNDEDKEASSQKNLQMALKLTNTIRAMFGAPSVPATFFKVANIPAQIAGRVAGSFSGQASWYGPQFHGRKTSDGSRFDMNKLTAAHKTLPFGTKLLVMNRKTGDSCIVKVNDRGPFVGDRVIDLSRGAARQLNMLSSGVAVVDCVVLGTHQSTQ